MKERLQEYALVAEIVSAMAIVLSLIFVGLQIRQGTEETAANSRALEAAVRESMLNADMAIFQAEMPFPSIGRNNNAGTAPTDPDDAIQMRTFNYMMTRTRENYWKQHSNGMLDDETYLSYRGSFLFLLLNSDFHLSLWNETSSILSPGFVAEINDELRQQGRLPRTD